MLADFTIIGEDFFDMDEDRIRYLPVLKTIVGGRQIWPAD
jgi:predicted amidohydrolase YtcJ